MTERPIIFDAESIRQILAGRKTQTRRIVNLSAVPHRVDWIGWSEEITDREGKAIGPGWCAQEIYQDYEYGPELEDETMLRAPYGEPEMVENPDRTPGDVARVYVPSFKPLHLWVREKWFPMRLDWRELDRAGPILYADGTVSHLAMWGEEYACTDQAAPKPPMGHHWKSPLFMPRWASRITLQVESIRIERLNAMSEDDAIAEGMEAGPNTTPREQYELRWDELNAARGFPWIEDPNVWAITFSRIEAPTAKAA